MQSRLFVLYIQLFGRYPSDLLYVPLIEKDSSHAVGRLACSANDSTCFLTVILACIKKKKCRFSSFFPSTWPQSESDCSHAATGAVIHRTKGHTCHFHQPACHYIICWPSSQPVNLKCNAHPRTVKEWVEKAM